MKKVTMILMAFITLTMTAYSQWSLQTNPLTGNNSLGKIQFVSATEGWIAASHSGKLLHTTNAGTTWNIVNPFPADSVGNMSDPATTMSWTNPMHGWALKTYIVGTGDITSSGNGAVLYNTTDGGSSWTKKEFPKTITTVTYSTADLQGIWQIHELVVNNPSSSNKYDGWVHGTLTLDATGSGSETNVVATDGSKSDVSGVSLQISSVGKITVGSSSDLHGFMSADKNTIFITETEEKGGGYCLIVLQKNVSTTYSLSDLQGTWQMHGLSAGNSSGDHAGWVHATLTGDVGGNLTGNFVGVGGNSSINTTASISSNGIISGMSSIGSDVHGFMSADKNTFYITMTKGGNSDYNLVAFQKQITGTTYATADLQGIWQLHALVSDNIYDTDPWASWTHAKITLNASGAGSLSDYVVNNESRDDVSPIMSMTSDGIVSFDSIPNSHGFLSADKSLAILTMPDMGSGGYTLGIMQKDVSISGDIGLQTQFVDNNNGWMSDYNGIYEKFIIYKTTDGGDTWNTTSNTVGGIYYFVDATNGWMIGNSVSSIGSSGLNNIYHTINGGVSWVLQASNIGSANALHFTDLLNGWIVGQGGLTMKTTDGGTNWTTVTITGQTSNSDSKTVFFLDANHGWIGTHKDGEKSHYILATTDGGVNWISQSTPANYSIFSLNFWDATNGWLTSDYGQIAHYTYTPPKTVNITAGGLDAALTASEKSSLKSLTVTGTIDARDFKTLRDDMPLLAEIDLSGATVTEYTGTLGTFYDTSITTYPANTIPQRAFYYTATKTGKTSLKSFIFPASVTDIGMYAFRSSGLTSITIPSTVTSIGYGNFVNCINLTSIIIPSSISTIGDYAFQNCVSLISVNIPSNVTEIGYGAFFESGLQQVTLNEGLKKIGDYAFQDCHSLQSISIPSTVTEIGYAAFLASGLQQINLNEGLKKIGDYAFIYCYPLQSISIPSTVTEIGNGAFNSSGLQQITLNEGLKTIGNYAFQSCDSLQSISIPSTITSIGYCAFTFDNALKSINVSAQNPFFSSVDGVFYNKSQQKLLCFPGGKATNFVIPSTVLVIDTAAFEGSNIIRNVVIPSSVTTLSPEAFYRCQRLESIDIPASVTAIGGYSFYNCTAIQYISVHSTAPVDLSASDSVFYNIDMNSCILYVPLGSKSLYKAADKWKDFSNIIEKHTKSINVSAGGLYAALTSIELNTVTDLNISGQIDARDFRIMRDSMPLLANIDIRGVSIAEYTGTEGTSGSTSIKYWGDNLPPDAFKNPVTYVGKQTLKSIILPSYLWAIGGAAFANSALEKVVMPSTVYDIQSWSFSGTNISSIFIPASVTTIGSSAFGGTNKLPSIDVSAENQYFTSVDGVLFDKSVTKLLAFPSAKCQYYTIPTGVTSIEANAFQASDILEELTIPSTVTKIGNSAFIWSWGLKKVIIPASVTTIEANAFNSCENLSKIYVASSTPMDLSSSVDVFLNVDKSSCILYVPVGSKAAYQAAGQWSDFQNIVETGGSVTYNVTVPVGTKACYIAGEMNSWIHQIMTKLDDTHYTITIQNADISQEYKYCSGPSWDYQEMSATNDYFPNRSYSANDVVANWLAIFDPSTVTASDYYLPLSVGNYTKLHTNYIAPNTNWCDRSTKYSFIKIDNINGVSYLLEEGWEGEYLPGECLGANPIFRYLWLRKDEAGNIMLGATATNEDQYGNLSSDLSSAMILPEPMALFPNKFLRVNEFISYPQSETVTAIDSVISVTATAGSYTNCIQVRSLHRTTGGIVTFIEDSYYAYHVGLVMQNRLLPVDQIHTNYITSYQADPATGLKELKSSDFSVLLYPNPATDGFYIKAGEKITTVSVYNLSGILELSEQVSDNGFVSISNLLRGLYIVKVKTTKGTAEMKLIKK